MDRTQQQLLLERLTPPPETGLRAVSIALLTSIRDHLRDPAGPTMLPSYIHRLPSTQETGSALAVELGGSTLRVALLQLNGSAGVKIVARRSWAVDDDVKRLPGAAFFDWVAERIAAVVVDRDTPLGVGLTWSFPIVQTGPESGKVQKMGKGFRTHEGIEGTDMRGHFEAALKRQGLHKLELTSLLNDTTAMLLAHAYTHPATRISLVCGTGVNAAVLLPVAALHPQKFDAALPASANNVLVNTECSMLGGDGIFPVTPADTRLDTSSDTPAFQPFEQLTSGRYLGEVVRLTLEEAGMAAVAGRLWSLRTEVAAAFEEDATLPTATGTFEAIYGIRLTPADARFVASICRAVAQRAAAYLAVMVYTLHRLQCEMFDGDKELSSVSVAFCGAVLEKHPSMRRQCQEFLDLLAGSEAVRLELAEDSGLVGAAVGVLLGEAGRKKARL